MRTLNNVTTPANLLTWTGQPSQLGLTNIREQDGVITFEVEDVYVLREISLPDSQTVFAGITMKIEAERTPDYAPYTLEWSSSAPDVATVDSEGRVTGISDGTAVITVQANQSEELVAQCLVTVVTRDIYSSIADFKSAVAEQSSLLSLNDAVVLYAHNNQLYIRDESGAMVLSQSGINANRGDVINGLVQGHCQLQNKIPYFSPDKDFTPYFELSEGSNPEPRPVLAAELSDSDYADYLTLHQVSLQRLTVGGVTGLYAVDGDRQVRLYNVFGIRPSITVPSNIEGKYFDVPGILLTRLTPDSVLIDELALLGSPVEVEAPEQAGVSSVEWSASTPVDVFTAEGRHVARTTFNALKALPLRRGVYVVRSADDVKKIVRP